MQGYRQFLVASIAIIVLWIRGVPTRDIFLVHSFPLIVHSSTLTDRPSFVPFLHELGVETLAHNGETLDELGCVENKT